MLMTSLYTIYYHSAFAGSFVDLDPDSDDEFDSDSE